MLAACNSVQARTPLVAINFPLSHNFQKQMYLSTLELAPRNKTKWNVLHDGSVYSRGWVSTFYRYIYVLNRTGHFEGTKLVATSATALLPASLYDGNSTQHETSMPAQTTKSTITHVLKTHVNIALPSTASSTKLTLSFMISNLNSTHVSQLSNAFYMSNPLNLPDLIIVIVLCEEYSLWSKFSSRLSCHFLLLRSIFSSAPSSHTPSVSVRPSFSHM
jgi:hypothetical protein